MQPQLVPADKFEWLALMQHHGAPTRLLDFTRSPYVAAYFAIEDKGEGPECAVWAIDRSWCAETAGSILASQPENKALLEAVKQLVGDTPQQIAFGLAYAVTHQEKLFASAVLHAHTTMVIPVEPDRLSERLSVQQGTFLCAGNVDLSFVENLTAMDDWESHVRKYTLSFSHRGHALEQLRKMNITRASLFPGLDGYAQSFRNSLEREDPKRKIIRLALSGLDLAMNAPQEGVRVSDVAKAELKSTDE